MTPPKLRTEPLPDGYAKFLQNIANDAFLENKFGLKTSSITSSSSSAAKHMTRGGRQYGEGGIGNLINKSSRKNNNNIKKQFISFKPQLW
jgi:hypothetical protein